MKNLTVLFIWWKGRGGCSKTWEKQPLERRMSLCECAGRAWLRETKILSTRRRRGLQLSADSKFCFEWVALFSFCLFCFITIVGKVIFINFCLHAFAIVFVLWSTSSLQSTSALHFYYNQPMMWVYFCVILEYVSKSNVTAVWKSFK